MPSCTVCVLSSNQLLSLLFRSPSLLYFSFLFFFNDPATTEIYTLSLHDALPISAIAAAVTAATCRCAGSAPRPTRARARSEEHTSELQSPCNLVCRLLLEKKKEQMKVEDLTIRIINIAHR